MMDFQYFLDNKKVIEGKVDNEKSKSLIKMSMDNLKAVRKLPKNKLNASIILVMGYESLRQILEAMALKKGYKVFSHEAYTYYLRSLGEVAISAKFDRLRRLRSGINYYGKAVGLQTALNGLDDVGDMIGVLVKKYLDLEKS